MVKHIEVYDRALREANYILETGSTIRKTAQFFKVSKTVVYRDVTKILLEKDRELSEQVQDVLNKNRLSGQIKGGESTKQKHLKK